MTHLEAIRKELVLDAAVTALVGDRVFPLVMPQNSEYPALVLTVISDTPENSYDGETDGTPSSSVRLQVDAYHRRIEKAYAAANAARDVIASLSRADLSATCVNVSEFFEPESELYRISSDFMLWR